VVNSVTTYVRYWSSPDWQEGCVATGTGSDLTAELSLTSWYLYSDNPADYYYCMDDGDGGLYPGDLHGDRGLCDLFNPLFCVGITTWAEYYPQKIDGNSDGSLDAYYEYIITGSPCSGFLSPQQIQVSFI
jgi:hypothetical protein